MNNGGQGKNTKILVRAKLRKKIHTPEVAFLKMLKAYIKRVFHWIRIRWKCTLLLEGIRNYVTKCLNVGTRASGGPKDFGNSLPAHPKSLSPVPVELFECNGGVKL